MITIDCTKLGDDCVLGCIYLIYVNTCTREAIHFPDRKRRSHMKMENKSEGRLKKMHGVNRSTNTYSKYRKKQASLYYLSSNQYKAEEGDLLNVLFLQLCCIYLFTLYSFSSFLFCWFFVFFASEMFQNWTSLNLISYTFLTETPNSSWNSELRGLERYKFG